MSAMISPESTLRPTASTRSNHERAASRLRRILVAMFGQLKMALIAFADPTDYQGVGDELSGWCQRRL